MKNRKGFTLVELLAVIVILAIVALVTTPAILNVIDDSRKSGAEDKAWGVIKAVELAYSESQYHATDPALPYTHDFGNESNGLTVNIQGEKPTEGKVFVAENGQLSSLLLKFDKQGTYYCTTNTSGTKMCCSKTASDVDSNAKCSDTSNNTISSISQNFTPQYYAYPTSTLNINDTVASSSLIQNSQTLGRKCFIGHDVNSEGKVVALYGCFIINNTQYCMKGKDTINGINYFQQDKALLGKLRDDGLLTCSRFDDDNVTCTDGVLNKVVVNSAGYVSVWETNSIGCNVSHGGKLICFE